jgi:hypothetical protein
MGDGVTRLGILPSKIRQRVASNDWRSAWLSGLCFEVELKWWDDADVSSCRYVSEAANFNTTRPRATQLCATGTLIMHV